MAKKKYTEFPTVVDKTGMLLLLGDPATGELFKIEQSLIVATFPVFTSVSNGLAPLSGGGTTNFLRADGTWAAVDLSAYLTSAIAASTYSVLAHTHTFASLTSKPTTLAGYGIIDAAFLPLAGGTLTGNLLFSADNTYDIGASGATRPRTAYFGTSIQVGDSGTISAAFSANLTLSGAGYPTGYHAFEDYGDITITGAAGYASFDANPIVGGTSDYGHLVGFQARPTYNGSGNITSYFESFNVAPTHNGAGTIANVRGLRITDIAGAGPVTNSYGIQINAITRGTTSNYAIHSSGGQVFFAGNTGIGVGAITSQFNVYGTSTFNGLVTMAQTTGGASAQFIKLQHSNSVSAGAQIDFGIVGSPFNLSRIESVFEAANQSSLRFYTYNTGLNEKMRIDTAGRMGIGTTTPKYPLDVATGTILSRNSLGGSFFMEDTTVADASTPFGYFKMVGGVISVGNANRNAGTGLSTGSVDRLTITAAGNVGIGTASPAARLQLAGAISSTSWTTNGSMFSTVAATHTDTSSVDSATIAHRTANSFGIPTFATTGLTVSFTEASTVYIAGPPVAGTNVTITNNAALVVSAGNVGIGTGRPADKLTVANTSSGVRTTAIRVENNLSVASTGISIDFDVASSTTTTGRITNTMDAVTSERHMSFDTSNGSTLTEKLRITGLGNVGIGITAPTGLLHFKAGTATASTAPLKFTAGTLLTTPESGVIETDASNELFYTNSGAVRARFAMRGYIAKTATYTATNSDYTIDCTANTFTVTLPTAVGIAGRVYYIVNSGSGTITLATTSSQTFTDVVGTPTTLTVAAKSSVEVQSTGANWMQINSGTITSDNGITKTGNTFQLGGTALSGDTTIPTSAFSLAINSSSTSETLRLVNTGTNGSGVYASATSGTAVIGISTSGFGVAGLSTSSYGGDFESTTNTGLLAQGVLGAEIRAFSAVTNTVISVMELQRTISGTAADGIGGSIQFKNETDTGDNRLANELIWKWTTAADATRTSQFSITGVNSAVTQNILTIAGDGKLILNQYSTLATYANEAAAVTGGLAQNTVYKTATGELRIKL